jgi:hypothetical protein
VLAPKNNAIKLEANIILLGFRPAHRGKRGVKAESDFPLTNNVDMSFVPLASGHVLPLEENPVADEDARPFLSQTGDSETWAWLVPVTSDG